MKTQAAVCVSTVALGFCASTFLAPPSKADTQCPYPGVGILNVNVGGIGGGFCDFPTEINGAHWHCEGGGVSLGLGGTGVAVGSGGTVGIAGVGQGVNGVSCNWRCPDNTDAPAPNPPGQWREYLVPMNTTNFCKDHMEPAGFWSDPVLPTGGNSTGRGTGTATGGNTTATTSSTTAADAAIIRTANSADSAGRTQSVIAAMKLYLVRISSPR